MSIVLLSEISSLCSAFAFCRGGESEWKSLPVTGDDNPSPIKLKYRTTAPSRPVIA